MLGVVCNEKSTNVETLKYSSDNWALAQYHTDTEDQVIFVKKWRSAKGENLYAVAIVDLEKTDITQRSPTIWAIPVGNIFSLLPDYRYSDHRSFPYLTPSSQRDDARNFPVLVDESPLSSHAFGPFSAEQANLFCNVIGEGVIERDATRRIERYPQNSPSGGAPA